MNNISRRKFLGFSAGAAGTMLMPSCSHVSVKTDIPVTDNIKKGYIPDVSAAWIPKDEGKKHNDIFRQMMQGATDFSWLSKGDTVFLKLSLNSDKPYPATTDPWILQCMIRLLKEKGAKRIIAGDQSGMETVRWTKTSQMGSSRKCCESAGLLKVITEEDAESCFFEERGYDAYKPALPGTKHHWQEPMMITDILDETDHIIYLPRVASHMMGDISSGLKIGVGFLREDSRLALHQGGSDFYSMYEEISEAPVIKSKLRLIVSSGRHVLSNFGPDAGSVNKPDKGLIFASADLLANELLAYAWLKWNREFATSSFSNATTGSITGWRSPLNRFFVWWVWGDRKKKSTPAIPFYEAGSIYGHPAVSNRIQRSGYPEKISINYANDIQDSGITGYINNELRYIS